MGFGVKGGVSLSYSGTVQMENVVSHFTWLKSWSFLNIS